MHAAVVTSFDNPPRYTDRPDPVATRPGELVVDVVAAALYQLVRSRADGSHYTSARTLPLVPGVDAVVRDADGRLRYAVLDDTPDGTMADRTVVEADRTVPLPDGVDPVVVAAAMNPAMSSWVALRRRIDFRPGSRVLVLGATGAAGRIAVQVAKRFGAAQVVGAGRDAGRLAGLAALGADRTLALDELAQAADVDVVLDYLWGDVAARGMVDVLTHRADRRAPLTWVEIGSMAGATAPVPGAALRAGRLELVGSGFGSVSMRDFAAELPAIAEAASRGELAVDARAVPLADVERAWTEPVAAGERIVFVP
jgi:NADPH:quinone reductase-like Zn-dependent oxidoreductase